MTSPPGSDTAVSRGAVLMALGGAGVAIGLPTGVPAIVALGAALFAATFTVWWLLGRSLANVRVTRVVPRAACEGDVVNVVIAIRRSGRLPLYFLRLTDVFGPQTRARRTIDGPARLDRASQVELEYEATCVQARGIYPVGPVVVYGSDPFCWFTRSRVVLVAGEMKVYPKLHDPSLPDRVVASFSEPHHAPWSARAGDSDEFYAVRDFRPGDLLKRIHWPSTARRGFPVVKEYLPSVQRELVVFLDVSRDLRFAGARLRNFESSVRFVASLAARASRAGFRIELRCGHDGAHDVPGSSGRRQYVRIVETLVPLRTRTEDPFAAVVARGARRWGRSAVAVVVLHPYLVGNGAFESSLRLMVSRGNRVVCLVYAHRKGAYGPRTEALYQSALRRLAGSGVELWRTDA